MKIRFEPQKTTLRLSKDEFNTLLENNEISESTTFPDESSLEFCLKIEEEQDFQFKEGHFLITLSAKSIREYKPAKVGITFMFQLGNKSVHKIILEVDIKKKPLNF
jgi:hypothetical protein